MRMIRLAAARATVIFHDGMVDRPVTLISWDSGRGNRRARIQFVDQTTRTVPCAKISPRDESG